MRIWLIVTICLFLISSVSAAPINSRDVRVIDGDTIVYVGEHIRLVGFDTPESGNHAQCSSERSLAAKATFTLRRLVAGGGLDLAIVPCSCRPGTEGTMRCNYGRACGVLKARGVDVGKSLIRVGLARPYLCSARSCPPRQGWC